MLIWLALFVVGTFVLNIVLIVGIFLLSHRVAVLESARHSAGSTPAFAFIEDPTALTERPSASDPLPDNVSRPRSGYPGERW